MTKNQAIPEDLMVDCLGERLEVVLGRKKKGGLDAGAYCFGVGGGGLPQLLPPRIFEVHVNPKVVQMKGRNPISLDLAQRPAVAADAKPN